jgi:hypothetical protein
MHYRIGGQGFFVGSTLIPASTEIDDSQTQWAWLAGIAPPIDAIALSQETYNYMVGKLRYPASAVRPGPGVVPVAPKGG